ncbi:hypothetical protein LCGC14_0245490 [marine sediment metagenome]|uniref:Uncharacterized protein n=1 Tax=marine sediment metagenome TaxID=412755 RepID=A0A0F9XAG8_9ZZZZ
MSIGGKSVGMVVNAAEVERLKKDAEEELKRIKDAKQFISHVIEVYELMKVTPFQNTIVVYPMIQKATRGGILIKSMDGSDWTRSEMRKNYHIVVDWDRNSELIEGVELENGRRVKGLDLKVGDGIQVDTFPFPFGLPHKLEKFAPDLKDVDLYGIRAFEVIAKFPGINGI